MKIIINYKNNNPRFDSLNSNAKQAIQISDTTINIDFNEIINTQFTGGNVGADFNHYKQYLGLGIYSKAPCGGFPNFFMEIGNNGKKYVLFSGINEVSNSHYFVTIHKIIEL